MSDTIEVVERTDSVIELVERGPKGDPGGGGGGAESDPVALALLANHAAEEPAHGGDLAGAARPPTAHDHDDRYFTEGEVAAALGLKQDAATAATDIELEAVSAVADAALPKAGGTMTGPIVLDADPIANLNPATKQWVAAQIAALINGAPGALDTLKEIADQLALDESAVTALTATVAGKLAAESNLADLLDAVEARTNLGLGSAATADTEDFDTAGAAAAAQAASQPLDSDLTAIAALSTTSFGRAFLALADAAAARTAIGASTDTLGKILTGTGVLQVGNTASTTAATGLQISTDAVTNLYRSAASTLRTDGRLLAAGGLRVNQGAFISLDASDGVAFIILVGGIATLTGALSARGGFRVQEAANTKQGVATLVGGTVTVSNTSITANSRIFLTAQSLGTVTTPKALAVTARSVGTSFTITSADATDTSVVAYEIFEPGN